MIYKCLNIQNIQNTLSQFFNTYVWILVTLIDTFIQVGVKLCLAKLYVRNGFLLKGKIKTVKHLNTMTTQKTLIYYDNIILSCSNIKNRNLNQPTHNQPKSQQRQRRLSPKSVNFIVHIKGIVQIAKELNKSISHYNYPSGITQ